MMLRRKSGPKRNAGENFTMRSFMICRLLFKLLGSILGGGGRRLEGHVVCTGNTRIKSVSRKTLKGREHSEDINDDRRIILKWILYK